MSRQNLSYQIFPVVAALPASAGDYRVVRLSTDGELYEDASGGWRKIRSAGGSGTPPRYDLFGMGTDGAVTLDATNLPSPSWASRSGNVYTLSRDLVATTLVVPSGYTLNTNGYRVFANVSATINGTLGSVGGNATGGTGGTATPFGYVRSGSNGANATAGSAGSQVGSSNFSGGYSGAGGSSGQGQSGGAYQSGTLFNATFTNMYTVLPTLISLSYALATVTNYVSPGASGSSGGSAASSLGGGGGAGGGVVFLATPLLTGSGTVTGRAGNGGAATSGNAGGGGGGGGGWIQLVTTNATTSTPSFTQQATQTVNGVLLDVTAGSGGAGIGTGSAGTAGAHGRINVAVVF